MKKDFWSVERHQQSRQFGVDQLDLALSDLTRGGKDLNWKLIDVAGHSGNAHRPTERVRNENVDLSAW